MQTHEWEALLDGTTPGPWEWHGGQDPDMRFIYADEGGMCMTVEPVGSAYRDADPVLAAHAPAAVAEVIRLRKAIAELAAEERATADDEFFPAHLRDLCRAYADDLARILEGVTDE